MDRHSIAAISVIGITLDLLGGMYLAYDLLGGKHGPLRTLTRVVTYGLFFGLGLPLGLAFGIAGDKAMGDALEIQARIVAENVTTIKFADTSHWLMEERPMENRAALKNFFWAYRFVRSE